MRLSAKPGENIKTVARRAVDAAWTTRCEITLCFNDVDISVMPGAKTHEIVDTYYAIMATRSRT